MEAYSGFAELYDLFMEEIPYDDWAAHLTGALREHGIFDGIVCELGCGTGQITRRLAKAGYDMIGVDLSPEMLAVANRSEEVFPSPILYLQQDIRGFELYGTVRAVVSVCDTLNYLQGEEDLGTVFSLVNNYLDPGGIFIFDFNLPPFYASIGDRTIAEDRGEASFIWENTYDPSSGRNEYAMTFYAQEEDGRYRRFEEEHEQWTCPAEEIERILAESGLRLLRCEDAERGGEIREDTGRAYFYAEEQGKSAE